MDQILAQLGPDHRGQGLVQRLTPKTDNFGRGHHHQRVKGIGLPLSSQKILHIVQKPQEVLAQRIRRRFHRRTPSGRAGGKAARRLVLQMIPQPQVTRLQRQLRRRGRMRFGQATQNAGAVGIHDHIPDTFLVHRVTISCYQRAGGTHLKVTPARCALAKDAPH